MDLGTQLQQNLPLVWCFERSAGKLFNYLNVLQEAEESCCSALLLPPGYQGNTLYQALCVPAYFCFSIAHSHGCQLCLNPLGNLCLKQSCSCLLQLLLNILGKNGHSRLSWLVHKHCKCGFSSMQCILFSVCLPIKYLLWSCSFSGGF